jgi:hypothetical protein
MSLIVVAAQGSDPGDVERPASDGAPLQDPPGPGET